MFGLLGAIAFVLFITVVFLVLMLLGLIDPDAVDDDGGIV
jgi:hypothetical protein